MQLENGLLHLFVLFDLEWEPFLVWRYSKINKDPHLGKTRFKMAFNNHRDASLSYAAVKSFELKDYGP